MSKKVLTDREKAEAWKQKMMEKHGEGVFLARARMVIRRENVISTGLPSLVTMRPPASRMMRRSASSVVQVRGGDREDESPLPGTGGASRRPTRRCGPRARGTSRIPPRRRRSSRCAAERIGPRGSRPRRASFSGP